MKNLTWRAAAPIAMVLATGAMAFAPLARAETPIPVASEWSYSGNMSLVSDYRFRSISQTYRQPAVQAGLDLNHRSGFYAGTWASNVSGNQYPGGNGMELDLYGGYRFELNSQLKLDAGLMYYAYPDAKVSLGNKSFNTTEVYVGVARGNFSAKFSYALSDSFGVNDSDGSYYLDLNYVHPLTKATQIVAHLGRQDVRNGTQGGAPNPDYTDYKLGVTTEAAGLTWGLAYLGNNARDSAYTVTHVVDGSTRVVSKDTVVLSVGKTF